MVDLFDPKVYQGVRRPLTEAETLPPACYSSPEFHRREVDAIFLKTWNLIGRLDYVKKPGDYFTFELVGIPAFVMRGQDGKVRAFINSCRHRGAKLLDGDGHCSTIRCPYHSWIYDNQGRLKSAVGMQGAANFDPATMPLMEIRLDTWAGFIFVNFSQDGGSLAEYLGDLGTYTQSYGLENMVTVKRKDFVVRSNWKLYIENSMENFHLPTVHERSIGNVQAVWTPVIGQNAQYLILQSKTEKSRATLDGDTAFDRIPNLSGAAAEGAQYILVYPCTVIGCDLDCMWFKQMVPEGPDQVRVIAAFCFTPDQVARPDFDKIVQSYHRRFETVIGEDNGIAERQYAGLNTPFSRAGRLSRFEPLVHVIDNWILDRVVGPPAGPGP